MPEDRRPLLRAITGETIRGEVVRWLRKDGTPIILRLSTSSNADGTGGVLITFTDITEERRLHFELARFEHLFRHADDLIVVLDADGLVQYSSPSAERVLGYEAGIPLGGEVAGVLGIVHSDDADTAATSLLALTADDAPVPPFTVRVRTREGDWRHLECVGVNLLAEPDVQGIVLTARDTTERERLNAQLAHLAAHDPLTDLPNRSVLVPRLRQALARADREGSQVGLCFVDLDRFKAVNDDLGHAVGDSVIREVADRLRDHTRLSDTAVRIGGDEFISCDIFLRILYAVI